MACSLYFSSKGLWNPVGSADLHLLQFLCLVILGLCLFVFFILVLRCLFYFVVKSSEQEFSNLRVQKRSV